VVVCSPVVSVSSPVAAARQSPSITKLPATGSATPQWGAWQRGSPISHVDRRSHAPRAVDVDEAASDSTGQPALRTSTAPHVWTQSNATIHNSFDAREGFQHCMRLMRNSFRRTKTRPRASTFDLHLKATSFAARSVDSATGATDSARRSHRKTHDCAEREAAVPLAIESSKQPTGAQVDALSGSLSGRRRSREIRHGAPGPSWAPTLRHQADRSASAPAGEGTSTSAFATSR
jgi:hypothetical protein